MKKVFWKVVAKINRYFALLVIILYKRVYSKQPEGVQSSMICFRDTYKDNPEFKEYVRKMYKDIAKSELRLDTKLQPIKKGGEKYFIIVAKDKNLKTVFSLKRHGTDGEVKEIKASYSEQSKN